MSTPGPGDNVATQPTMAAPGADIATAPTQATDGAAAVTGTAATALPGDLPGDAPTPLPTIPRDTYELLGEHGRGGLGRVLRARDRRTGRVVAIKEMLGDRAMAERRFRREAIVTANLQHPAIVPVYEVGQWPDGAPFYAMKLVEGRSLDRVIAQATTADARLALLPHLVAIADAIAYAHDRGFLHRDLKPANVLVGAFGETVVIDWGLAKRFDDAPDSRDERTSPDGDDDGGDGRGDGDNDDHAALGVPHDGTRAGALVGTPVFMAPEQAAGEPLDRRADVYALGAMLYQLLGGKVPYAESTGATVIADVLRGPPTPLARLAPRTPRELLAIVGRAMARERDARYATAGELAAELRRFMTGQLVRAHEYTRWQRLARFVRRHKVVLAAATITTLVVAVVTALSYREVSAERDLARTQQRAAEDARARAQAHLAALHLELGRRELSEGKPPRALPHLIESARLGVPGAITAGLRLLAGRAAASVAPVRASVWLDAPVVDAQRPAGRAEWLVATEANTVVRLDLATGRTIMRATSPGVVSDLDLDPAAGTLLISGEATVVWDARSGAERGRLPPEPLRVRAAIASSGLRAHGDLTGAIEVWPPGATAPARRWPGHPVGLRDFLLAPDGARLITTDDAFDGVVWDTATGAAVARFRGIAALAPDGTWFAHIPADADATVRRVRDGAVIATLPGTRDQRDVYVGPGGVIVTLGRDGEVAAWRPDGAPIARYDGHVKTLLVVVAISDDGRWLVSGDEQGVVRVFELATGALHARFDQGRGTILAVQLGDGAAWAAALSHAGEVTVWDVPRPHPTIALAGHADQARRLTFADDGATVLTAGRDGALVEWDAATGAQRRRVDAAHDGAITWVTTSPDGARVVTTGRDGAIAWWDRELRPVARWTAPGAGSLVSARFVSPDRLLAGRDDGSAEVWDVATATRRCATPAGAELINTSVAPDGTWFVTHHIGGEVRRFAVDGCAPGPVMATGMVAAMTATITPDGAQVIVTGQGRAAGRPDLHGVQVFDAATGAVALGLGAPGDSYLAAAVSDDGARLAAAAIDGKVRLWSLPDGALVRELSGGTALLGAVGFAHDGALVVGGDDDGVLRVWDTTTGAPLLAERVLAGGVYFMRQHAATAQIALAGLAPAPQLVTLPRWSGSVDELAALARCRVPWQLDGSQLRPRELPRGVCDPAAP